jgi:hypothetical protein
MNHSLRSLRASAIVVAAVALPVSAARVTDVIDAAEPDDPVDVRIQVVSEFQFAQGVLTRERFQANADGTTTLQPVRELAWQRTAFQLRPRLDIALFRDLAIFTEWPIELLNTQRAQLADGTAAGSSSLLRDNGSNDPANTGVDGFSSNGRSPDKAYTDWRLSGEGSFASYRRGLKNPVFGLRYSPFSQERDSSRPTVTLQLDYTAPFFSTMNPTTDVASDTEPGPAANGLHVFHASVAASRQTSILDPFFVFDVSLPLVSASAAAPPGLLDVFPTGMNGGFTIGTEIVPFEDKKQQQKLAFSVRGNVQYFSEGRQYSEVSDLFKQLTYVDQWARFGGQLSFSYDAFDFVVVELGGRAAYDTTHLLSGDAYGTDGNDANKQVDLGDVNERNRYFNPALDPVGRRVAIEQSVQLGAFLQLGVTF